MFTKNIWSFTMENKLTGIILNLILLGMVVILGLIVYWSVRKYEIIDYGQGHLQTTKQVYEVGEPLTYRSNFCKTGDYSSTIIRTLRDGVIYLFPVIVSKSEEGCYDFISTTTETPNVPSGTYVFETEVIYKVNPLKEVTYHYKSNEFEIVNDN